MLSRTAKGGVEARQKPLGRWKPGLEGCASGPSCLLHSHQERQGLGNSVSSQVLLQGQETAEILLPSLTQYPHWSSARTESCLHCELTHCPVTLGESYSLQCSCSSGATGFVWVLSLSPSPSLLRIPAPDMLRLWQSLQTASGIKGLLQGQTSTPNPHRESTTTTGGCSATKFWETNQSQGARSICVQCRGGELSPSPQKASNPTLPAF